MSKPNQNRLPEPRVFKPKLEPVYVMDKDVKRHCPVVKFLTVSEWKEAAPNKEVPGIFKKFIFKYQYMTPISELWIANALVRKYPSLELVDKDMKSFNFEDDLDGHNVFALKKIWLQYVYSQNDRASMPPLTKKELTRDIRKFREDGLVALKEDEYLAVKAGIKEERKKANQIAAKESYKKAKAKKAEKKVAEVV